MRSGRICIAVFFLLAAAACRNQNPEGAGSVDAALELFPSQEMWNSTLTLSKAGKPQAVIRYAHMVKYENRDTSFFDGGLQIDFFDEDGRHTSVLTSQKGEYHEKTNNVLGRERVVVVSDSGYTLKTEEIRWDNQREKIYSDSAITFITPDDEILQSRGFESNADLTHRKFYQVTILTRQHVDLEKLHDSSNTQNSASPAGKTGG